MSSDTEKFDEAQYVSYREFKSYTDQQAEREVTIAKELASYREMVSSKLAALKTAQYVQIVMLGMTLFTIAGDLVYRVMHP